MSTTCVCGHVCNVGVLTHRRLRPSLILCCCCRRVWWLMQVLPAATNPADAAKVCFTAAYTVVFLQQVLSLGLDDRRVHFANSLAVGGQQAVHLDWPLGAALEFLVRADADAAAADSARDAEDGAAVLPMPPGGDPKPGTQEINAVAFWLLMVALFMVTLTWMRCVLACPRMPLQQFTCRFALRCTHVTNARRGCRQVSLGACGLTRDRHVMCAAAVQDDVPRALGGADNTVGAVAGAVAAQRQPDKPFAGCVARTRRVCGGRPI